MLRTVPLLSLQRVFELESSTPGIARCAPFFLAVVDRPKNCMQAKDAQPVVAFVSISLGHEKLLNELIQQHSGRVHVRAVFQEYVCSEQCGWGLSAFSNASGSIAKSA